MKRPSVKRPMFAAAIAALALALSGGLPAQAAEITVLGGMGVVSAIRDLAPAFEQKTGHKVIISQEQIPTMNEKIGSGAPADVAAIAPYAAAEWTAKGKMVAGTATNFAQAGVGVAVKAGAPKPDISTVAAFKAAMLAAKSIGYSRGGSGNVAARVMEKLGIADELKARTQFIDGRPVAEDVAKGLVEIGLQQINVIIPVEGIDYVGPLPPDLQDTVKFTGAVLTSSKQPEAAKAFLAFIASPEAAPLIKKSAMEPWH
jgi:molybdate transport system substrate-binding protein